MNASDLAVPVEDRYFEDYVPGTVVEYGEIRVDEAGIIEFARRYDPQYIHVDREAAASGPFGGLIASGWQTATVMMRLLVDRFLPKNCVGHARCDRATCCAFGSPFSRRHARVQNPTEAWCAPWSRC